MRKEWLLTITSVTVTLILALLLIRWLAPQLLGIPLDLQLVQVQKEVPPFFDNIFQKEVLESKEFIINDPFILRAKPLHPTLEGGAMGPHDILGFRNRSVPNIADIITIGDSQTYGNNAPLEMNWPSALANSLFDKTNLLYNISVGGWGAIQYVEIFEKSIYLQPLLTIVAFYTGNDPLDSFTKVYGDKRWHDWRPNLAIKAKDAPNIKYPDNPTDQWHVKFSDGFETKFTPAYRYASNDFNNPVVRAGYDIMARAAEAISDKAKKFNIKIIFTIIPTKEFVYAQKVLSDNIVPRKDYLALVSDEKKNIDYLVTRLRSIQGVTYVDVASRLQSAVLQNPYFYQDSENGHPNPPGYKFIAMTIEPYARIFLPIKPYGLVVTEYEKEKRYYVIHNSALWSFYNENILINNGWDPSQAQPISRRFIDNLPFAAVVLSKQPQKYGPDSPFFK